MRLLATRLTAIASAVKRLFSPASLFRNSEQGAWYDPSDFSTLFQNSAGTTPVTAVEQPVGLVLDKRKGLVRGSELVTNGTFDNGTTGWTANGTATLAAELGGMTVTSTSAAYSQGYQNITATPGKTYEITFTGQRLSGALAWVLVGDTPSAQRFAAIALSGTAPTPYRIIVTAVENHIRLTVQTHNVSIGDKAFIDDASVRELPGNHATQATAASRPVLKQDANGKYYLFFDGVDDSLSTGSIDFTSTDKMTVFAGVRKLSDAATGLVVELSSSAVDNPGTFNIFAPVTGSADYRFTSKGVTSSDAIAAPGTNTAPRTSVLVGTGSISTDSSILRINGVQAATSATDQGTGNYSSNPLYIGRRGGTSLPFNGHLYSLIVRGAQSSDSQIASAESYVNSKTGAY